jgi:3-methyladenine DNA glycosylase AlkD
MDDVLKKLEKEIEAVDRSENRINYQRFFKEKLQFPEGLKVPVLRKISKIVFKEIRSRRKEEIFRICDELLASQRQYSRFFAFTWAGNLEKRYEKQDLVLFERWLKDHVNSWASCDHLCGSLGMLLIRFPELSSERALWAKSRNMWMRRASAVALIIPVRKGLLLDDVFKTAEVLLQDEEDLVQKGYGWMLKEAGNHFFEEVHDFVMAHKEMMPRTALRYAIEKWPQDKRREAMKKD